MCIQLYPATCTFGRMTRIFQVLLPEHKGGTDPEISQHKNLTMEKKILLQQLEPRDL